MNFYSDESFFGRDKKFFFCNLYSVHFLIFARLNRVTACLKVDTSSYKTHTLAETKVNIYNNYEFLK